VSEQDMSDTKDTPTTVVVNGIAREYSERPWGNYTVLDDDAPDHKVKRIVVHPGKRLSYQMHHKRAEHWFIVTGTALVTLDGKDITVKAGESIDIPREGRHRIANPGDTDVVFIEVQHGTYFGEDDIVRFDDDYGRADETEAVVEVPAR
jgi:mannose-6-phosphate isomerase